MARFRLVYRDYNACTVIVIFSALAFHGDKVSVDKIDLDPRLNYFRSNSREGNFIGLAKLMGSSDLALANHIKEVQDKARNGRRNAMSFLSDSFLESSLRAICGYIIECIVKEILRNGGRFGVLMDGSRNITSQERMSVVVRYINDINDIVERTVSFFNAKSTESRALYESLEHSLSNIGLSIANIVGCSFDGAMNMRSAANGVNGHIKDVNPDSIYTWCYSHQFHLSVQNGTGSSQLVNGVLKVAEDSAKIFRASYIRMNIWVDVAKTTLNFNSKIRLKLIGTTRWSSKQDAIATIMNHGENLFVLLKSLSRVCRLPNLDANTLMNASANLNAWTKYDQIVSAFVLKQVFSSITPTTMFLQKSGLNIMDAIQELRKCYERLAESKEDLNVSIQMAESFIHKVNMLLGSDEELHLNGFDCKIHLPIAEEKERIIVLMTAQFRNFIQQIQNGIKKVYEVTDETKIIYDEMAFLNPLNKESLSLHKLCTNNNIDETVAIAELEMFKTEFVRFQIRRETVCSFFNDTYDDTDDDQNNIDELSMVIEDERDLEELCANRLVTKTHPMHPTQEYACYCQECIIKYIGTNNERRMKYGNIYKIYKYIAMLPVTQVQCERDFSKMKLTKTRLRSSLGDETLENLMLISLHSTMFEYLDLNDLLKYMIEKSSSLSLYMHT